MSAYRSEVQFTTNTLWRDLCDPVQAALVKEDFALLNVRLAKALAELEETLPLGEADIMWIMEESRNPCVSAGYPTRDEAAASFASDVREKIVSRFNSALTAYLDCKEHDSNLSDLSSTIWRSEYQPTAPGLTRITPGSYEEKKLLASWLPRALACEADRLGEHTIGKLAAFGNGGPNGTSFARFDSAAGSALPHLAGKGVDEVERYYRVRHLGMTGNSLEEAVDKLLELVDNHASRTDLDVVHRVLRQKRRQQMERRSDPAP